MSTLASANRPSSVGNASAPARKRTKNGKMSSTIKRTHKRRRSGKRPGSGIQRVSVVDTGTDKIKHAHDTDENLAMRYLSKIQERYPTSQSDKYAQFSMIWLKYREGVHNGSIERRRGEQTERDDDVYAQVRELFKDEEDLVSGFEPFMTSAKFVSVVNESGSEGNSPRLNVVDALMYLDAVKTHLRDKPDVYNQFLGTMKDFKNERVDTVGLCDQVSTLLQKDPHLMEGFSTFLPSDYHFNSPTGGIEDRKINWTAIEKIIL